MGLESDIQDILELNNTGSSAKLRAYEKFKQLREKIKAGESTGNKIRDFVIVSLASLSPDNEKPYREVEAKVKENKGNQILVVKQDESIHGCLGIIPPQYIDPMFIRINTELKLGVLTSGLELDIQKGRIILPTEKYAIKYNGSSESKWELKEGSISFSWYDFMNLGKEIERRTSKMPNNSSVNFNHALFLHFGEEVEKYFNRDGHLDASYASYAEALNLLKVEAPERFRKKPTEESYQTRLDVINMLEKLTSQEAKLNAEIKAIYGYTKFGGFMEGGALTLVEDEDDARVVSMGPKMRLKETKETIQIYLKQAIKLEMYTGDLRIEKKPGIQMNVPVYISEMCKKYEVGLPK